MGRQLASLAKVARVLMIRCKARGMTSLSSKIPVQLKITGFRCSMTMEYCPWGSNSRPPLSKTILKYMWHFVHWFVGLLNVTFHAVWSYRALNEMGRWSIINVACVKIFKELVVDYLKVLSVNLRWETEENHKPYQPVTRPRFKPHARAHSTPTCLVVDYLMASY
jgi:hypothetical protein